MQQRWHVKGGRGGQNTMQNLWKETQRKMLEIGKWWERQAHLAKWWKIIQQKADEFCEQNVRITFVDQSE